MTLIRRSVAGGRDALVFALVSGALLAACARLEPDVGPLLAGACDNTDSNPDTSVFFSTEIRPIIQEPNGMGGCSCHLQTPTGPGNGILLSGLDLTSMATLRQGGNISGLNIVIENQPCESVLYQKVSDAPPFGSRMPLNGPPFFSTDQLQLLHDWIAEGAADN